MLVSKVNSAPASIRQVAALLACSEEANSLFTHIEASDRAISCRLPILGSNVVIRLVSSKSGDFLIGAYGLSTEAVQWLNEVIVLHASVVIAEDGKALQVLYSSAEYSDLLLLVVKAARLLLALRAQDEADDYSDEKIVPMYWASETFNFGDWIGPQVVHAYTGRQPVHVRRVRKSSRSLFTVGSILGVMNRNNADIWGTGLIKPLSSAEVESKKRLKGVKVHAVRGKLTQSHLQEQVGWDVPDIYGDPALLLPEIFPARSGMSTGIACVPHYVHRDEVLAGSPKCNVVDVRTEVASVADQISSADIVISSSLHGIILAQAYGVPWVRLDVTDRPLTGGDFKFNDFYSCLEADQVSTVQVSRGSLSSLDVDAIAKLASLPKLTIDLARLRESLPTRVAVKPVENYMVRG